MGKLTALGVRAATAPGRYNDGAGLSLVVKPGGGRSWIVRVQVSGRRRDFGLGSASEVSLAEARDAAAGIRKQYKSGLDPVEERRRAKAAPPPTFKAAAGLLHDELKPGWREGKHQEDWLSSLERHAFPKLGKLTVDKIDGAAIRDTLLPIWQKIPETARRVRQRIGAVLDWAHSNGHRDTEAPLRSVSKGLPRQTARREHFPAMPYADVPAFIGDMRRNVVTMGRLAVEFAILTAARSGEVRGAVWAEFDLDAATWTIPEERMKAKEPHTVPLPPRAVAIVKQLKEASTCNYVFPSAQKGRLSDMTLTKVLRDAKQPFTVHGFRSAFRDWAAECSNLPGEVAEAALAHVVRNPTERAYHRTKYLEKRRLLMADWAAYLERCPPEAEA